MVIGAQDRHGWSRLFQGLQSRVLDATKQPDPTERAAHQPGCESHRHGVAAARGAAGPRRTVERGLSARQLDAHSQRRIRAGAPGGRALRRDSARVAGAVQRGARGVLLDRQRGVRGEAGPGQCGAAGDSDVFVVGIGCGSSQKMGGMCALLFLFLGATVDKTV